MCGSKVAPVKGVLVLHGSGEREVPESRQAKGFAFSAEPCEHKKSN